MDTTTNPPSAPAVAKEGNRSAQANPAANGALDVTAAGARARIESCRLTRESPTVTRCEDDTYVRIDRDGRHDTVLLTSLYLDSKATLYRGPLDATAAKNGHSLVLTDVDGDGHEDLIAWTGLEGAYGGPSYDVLLFNPTDGTFYGAPALSELTVGANGLFSVEGNQLSLSSTDGCCTRYFDRYVIEKGEPKLIERVTEEREAGASVVRRKIERLVDGTMQEVK